MFHNATVRYIQLTDLHLLEEGPWVGFERALTVAAERKPDLLMITGDLARERGSMALYRAVQQRLDAFPSDWIVMPGNHDDPACFGDAFGRRYASTDDWHGMNRLVQCGGYRNIIIDSSSGTVAHEALLWLDATLTMIQTGVITGHEHPDVLIWIHHPVLTGFSRFMDEHYPLSNALEVRSVLERYSLNLRFHIFCGHYHCEDISRVGTATQYCTPSTWRQIDQYSSEFRPLPGDDEGACRVVDINESGVQTVVVSGTGTFM